MFCFSKPSSKNSPASEAPLPLHRSCHIPEEAGCELDPVGKFSLAVMFTLGLTSGHLRTQIFFLGAQGWVNG